MGSTKQHLLSIAALCISLGGVASLADDATGTSGVGASASWLGKSYPYLVVDQAVSDALIELGHNLDIAVDVSRDAGKKRVHHYDHEGSSSEFLKYLAAEHGLDWMVDRGRLVVSSLEERITRSWTGDVDSLDGANAALAKAGIDDSRYRIDIGAESGVLTLTAPPHYMAQAAPIIESALKPRATQTVRVIHGRARNGGT